MKLSPLPLLLALLGAGCAFSQGPPMSKIAPEINATLADQVPIAVGDLLDVRFSAPEIAENWDQEVIVQPDGRAAFKGLDEVPVAGFTAAQIDETLEEAYRVQFPAREPDLTIQVKERANRTVTVTGSVGESAALEIGPGRRLTLIEALGQTGGFDEQSAWMSNTLLVRWDHEAQKQIWWVIDARPRYWASETPILLQPWDVIYIPSTPIWRAGLWMDNWIRRMIPLPFVRSF